MLVIVAIIFTACSTPHPSDLPCSAGPAAEGICWKVLHESERILKQQICIVIFKFGAGIKSCLFKRIYLRLHPSRSIEHSVNLRFKRAAIMFLKFFLFACFAFWASGTEVVRATAFPSKRQTRFEVPATCFECDQGFFFYLLCLSFFVLNNVFLVWSGENVCLSLRLLVRLSKPFHNQMFQE